MINTLSNLNIFDGWERKHLRPDWVDFREILLKNQIEYFYHVTDESNIQSIKKEGLCSSKFCEKNDIKINLCGGNDISKKLDKQKQLENFVRLFIFKNNPLIHCFCSNRIPNPIFLRINPMVVYLDSTQFSDINATDKNATIGNNIDNFKKIMNFINKKENSINFQKLKQAEIMIRTCVPCKFILNIQQYGKSD